MANRVKKSALLKVLLQDPDLKKELAGIAKKRGMTLAAVTEKVLGSHKGRMDEVLVEQIAKN